MHDGRLREGVRVMEVDGEVVVHHHFFELALPRNWVNRTPEIRAILGREIHVDDLTSENREVKGVVEFLSAQNCFFRSKAKAAYSLREVKEIFEPIAVAWYADYYRHPLWNRLRRGELNLNGLAAWAIHNYHVSRAAGKSGSRCASRFPRKELRGFFRADVLEEYWHCDAFYFVRHPSLSISDRQVKEYVPLPASLAFEQHTVWVAESDWLAHLLISYFQESSIRFYSDCQDFYREVETAYSLPGFFKNWTAHMGLDFDHGHAENFVKLFDSDETVSHAALVASLSGAWFAFAFLYAALDQISEEAARNTAVIPRNPIAGGLMDPSANSLSPVAKELQARDLRRLANELAASLPPFAGAADERGSLRDALGDSLFHAMSCATAHDEIILLGKLIEDLARSEEFAPAPGLPPSSVALAAFLRTAAVDARSLLFLVQLAIDLQCEWATPGRAALARLASFLEESQVDTPCLDRSATLGLQWAELLAWRAGDRGACPSSFEI